jgi:hypothetical protein
MAWTRKSRKAASRRTTKQNKRQWSDQKFKKKMCKIRKKQATRPGASEAYSERMTIVWKNSKYRARQTRSRSRSVAYQNRGEKISKTLSGRVGWSRGLTKETDIRMQSISDGLRGRVPNYKKYGTYYEGKHGKIWMRSHWEVAFAEWCDKKGFDWLYEPIHFRVGKGPWAGETYTPDFFLPQQDMWVEVKGRLNESNEQKLFSFLKQHSHVPWIMLKRRDLQMLGVLDKAA